MKVEVVVADESLGDVIGDLSSRRGHIQGVESRPPMQIVRATVPLAQMFGYATDLRSITQGRASYTMEFLQYQEAPGAVTGGIFVAR
jgi:elongation factor G